MKLEEISNGIYAGQIMSRVTADKNKGEQEIEEVQVLVPKSISNGIIAKEDLGVAVIKKHIESEKITQEGDVVIKLSTPYDAAYITEENQGLVIPSFCAIIRGIKDKKMADPNFITAFLNTEYVRAFLKAKVAGATISMIKITDIRNLEVPEVLRGLQETIGKAYTLSGKKKETLRQMIDTETELMENIMLKSIKEAIE